VHKKFIGPKTYQKALDQKKEIFLNLQIIELRSLGRLFSNRRLQTAFLSRLFSEAVVSSVYIGCNFLEINNNVRPGEEAVRAFAAGTEEKHETLRFDNKTRIRNEHFLNVNSERYHLS
jgi:hypothetical protein